MDGLCGRGQRPPVGLVHCSRRRGRFRRYGAFALLCGNRRSGDCQGTKISNLQHHHAGQAKAAKTASDNAARGSKGRDMRVDGCIRSPSSGASRFKRRSATWAREGAGDLGISILSGPRGAVMGSSTGWAKNEFASPARNLASPSVWAEASVIRIPPQRIKKTNPGRRAGVMN
jgi:hypothetical protein